ncbi:MAG: hypothetical protein QOD06_3546 [Candidatus Binatota bacterium]|nr:hypothetical protein [Candidatus Binatota bacterium]
MTSTTSITPRSVLLAVLVLAVSGMPASAAGGGACSEGAGPLVAAINRNLRGPEGKMVVGAGTLTYGTQVKYVKFAHYFSPTGEEGFQGEDRSVNDYLLRKVRLVRGADDRATAMIFVPSLRQGRKMRFKPTQALFGTGEYHHYLLLPMTGLARDYSFTCAANGDKLTLVGTRAANASLAPYPTLKLAVSRRGDAWVVDEAECEGNAEFETFVEKFSSYQEVVPGYWAPADVRLNSVHVEIEWHAEPAAPWIISTQTARMELESIP